MKILFLTILVTALYINVFSQGVEKIEKNGKYGLKNQQGNVILEPIYESLDVAPEHHTAMSITVGKKGEYNGGYISSKGELIIPPIYKSACCGSAYNQMQYGYAGLCKEGKCGVFDSLGNRVTQLVYEDVPFISQSIAVVKNKEKYGMISLVSGKELTPIQYDMIVPNYRHKPWIIKLGSKNGLIDENGKEITSVKYDYVEEFIYDCDITVVKIGDANLDGNISGNVTGGKWGVVNNKGEEVLRVNYNQINILYNTSLKDYFIRAQIDGKQIDYDKNGTVID